MNESHRSTIVIGTLLILAGLFFAMVQIVPGLNTLIDQQNSWVLIIEGAAVVLLILGIALRAPDMAIPATIVAGVGGILFYQATTNNWGSWAYLWTLIPGFVGVGMIIANLLGARDRHPIRSALDSIGTSVVLFVIFAAIFGGLTNFGPYWPLLLIAAGVLLGVRALLRKY